MKTAIKTMAALLIAAATFTNCTKEVKGPKGDPGPQGPAGTNGTNGTNGVANISTTTLNVTGWNWDNTAKWRYAAFNGNVTALTQANIDKGAVMIYEIQSGGYIALPYSLPLAPDVTNENLYTFSLNSVGIYCFNSDGSDPNPSPTLFRLVVIPQGMIKPNIDLKNYNAVKQAYNLAQ